jgi:hypothetical protein
MNNNSKRISVYLRTVLIALVGTLAACSDSSDSPPPAKSRGNAAAATVTMAAGGNGVPVLFGHAAFDLAEVGYEQSEFFFEGTAEAYTADEPLTEDGKWSVTAFSPAFYKTRLVVNRPVDNKKFNGTVVIEWLNVSGGVDATPDWQHMHVQLIREGFAWVGVSAQAVGVAQLDCPGVGPGCRAAGDPIRYESLVHPGDSHSYDIFSQAGQAIRDQAYLILGDLVPKRLIAAGESQSAMRLTTYINAVHPVADVYDAFVVHSRSGPGLPLTQGPLETVGTPSPTYLRDDLSDPVMVFNNENDLGSIAARQDDGPLYRLWEVAGTAHYDQYGLVQAENDTGGIETIAEWFDSMRNPTSQPAEGFSCAEPINTGPATFVMRALIQSLHEWLVSGTPPPRAPRLETVSLNPVAYQQDDAGNVLGGIRTPAVDAPVARINGLGQPAGGTGGFCFLFGITVPFTDDQLLARYSTHENFVSAWNEATQSAVAAGFILEEDGENLQTVAEQSDILK